MAHILITGAGRGIGAALRAQALAQGHDVTGTARSAADGPGWLHLDVTSDASATGLSEALEGQALDWLICNAGVYLDPNGSIHDTPASAFEATFAANVTGVFRTIQAALPALGRGAAPRIAIISSMMGSSARAPGRSLAYRASKAAATNLARNLATDLRPAGIAVGAYHPGWVQSDMGGPGADITVEASAEGLLARIAALELGSTGVVEDYKGAPVSY